MKKVKDNSFWVYVLLGAGVLISGPRFSGAFASAIGIDLIGTNPIYGVIEINSGWALALFEAVAIAYVASRFRRIQILDEDTSKPISQRILFVNFAYWIIILWGMVFLLLSIPAVSTVHLATQTFKVNNRAANISEILTWSHIVNNHLTWAWLFLTSAASTLFVFLIGLVMEDFGILTTKKVSDTKVFNVWNDLRKVVPIVDPQTLSHKAEIPLQEAADFLDSLNPPIREPIRDRLQALKDRSNGV